jgi:hypothetical protein
VQIEARGFGELGELGETLVFVELDVLQFRGFVQMVSRFCEFAQSNLDVLRKLRMRVTRESLSRVATGSRDGSSRARAIFTILSGWTDVNAIIPRLNLSRSCQNRSCRCEVMVMTCANEHR